MESKMMLGMFRKYFPIKATTIVINYNMNHLKGITNHRTLILEYLTDSKVVYYSEVKELEMHTEVHTCVQLLTLEDVKKIDLKKYYDEVIDKDNVLSHRGE